MSSVAAAATLKRARELLAEHAGFALDERKDDALLGALEALAARLGLPDAASALDDCERSPRPGGPLDALVRALLVRETHVFRTREHFDALERIVLPSILEQRAGTRRVRAWSAGCATGEEAFSVAFALGDAAAAAGADLSAWDVVLLGSDVDPDSLELARRAEYRDYSFRGVTRLERARFFERVGEAWRVRDPWRGMVTFRRHDLVREPPPATMHEADLVLCRNVLMYFTPEAARRVLLSLVSTLAPGGWLLVGAAEHALVQDLPLELHAMPDALAYRRPGAAALRDQAAFTLLPLGMLPMPDSSPGLAVEPEYLATDPHDAPPPLDAARAALVAGDRHQAVELAVAALEAEPEDADACLFLGRLAADAGHAREAEAWLRKARQLRPDDAEAAYLLALLALEAGDARGAASLARQAAADRPDFVMALQLLARALRESGDEAGAAAALASALRALASFEDDALVPHAHDLPAAHLRSALLALARGARGR